IDQRGRRALPVRDAALHGEAGVIAQIVRVRIERARAQAAPGAQLVEEGLHRALQRRGQRFADRAHAFSPASPVTTPSVASTRLASARGMRAARATSSAGASRSAATEPNARSSAARLPGPIPGT